MRDHKGRYFRRVVRAPGVVELTLHDTRVGPSTLDLALENVVRWLEDDGGPVPLIIDLSEMLFLPSTALGLLTRIRAVVRRQGGALRLCGGDADILDVFRFTRLDQVFAIDRNLAAARAAFAIEGRDAPA